MQCIEVLNFFVFIQHYPYILSNFRPKSMESNQNIALHKKKIKACTYVTDLRTVHKASKGQSNKIPILNLEIQDKEKLVARRYRLQLVVSKLPEIHWRNDSFVSIKQFFGEYKVGSFTWMVGIPEYMHGPIRTHARCWTTWNYSCKLATISTTSFTCC